MLKLSPVRRLADTLLAAGIPVDGVRSLVRGTPAGPGNVLVDFSTAATPAQRTQAETLVARFDWSEAAHAAWERKQARMRAAAALERDGDAAQLTRAIMLAILAEINLLRAAVRLPARTAAQLKAAVRNRILNGDVDG